MSSPESLERAREWWDAHWSEHRDVGISLLAALLDSVRAEERANELTPAEDRAYTDGYREGFAAGAKAQQRAYAEYFFGDELYVSKLLKLPLVEPTQDAK